MSGKITIFICSRMLYQKKVLSNRCKPVFYRQLGTGQVGDAMNFTFPPRIVEQFPILFQKA